MQVTIPVGISPNQFYLIASARSVDANSLATTTAIWQNGANAANTIPIAARVFRKTGTLSLLVGSIRLNSTIIQPISSASSLLMGAGADPIQFLLDTTTSATVVPLSGNWDVVVGTINGTAATIDVEIWGFRTS